MTRMRTIRWLLAFAVVAGASLVIYADSGWVRPPPHQKFDDIGARLFRQPIRPAPFALTDHLGHPFTNTQLSGAWSVVFFGYTHCADVCPTTLSTLARVEERFVKSGQIDRPRFVFISVDPKRDSLDVLRAYVPFFSATLVGATGSQRELRALTGSLNVSYHYQERDSGAAVDPETRADGDEYRVEHTSDLHVFAPDGTAVGLIFPPYDPARVERVLTLFMAQ